MHIDGVGDVLIRCEDIGAAETTWFPRDGVLLVSSRLTLGEKLAAIARWTAATVAPPVAA